MHFGRKRYMTTIASLRSICLNDLYRHKDLWELAVEGDIHAVVSALQMSVPWTPNRRKRGWEKWGDAPFAGFVWDNDTSLEKKGDYIPLFLVCRGDGLNTFGLVSGAITSATRLSNWTFDAYEEWVSVQGLFIIGCHENKAVAIE